MRKNLIIISLLLVFLIIVSGCHANLGQSGIKTVKVKNTDEFLSSIAPNTRIILESGNYNLTESEKYGKADSSRYYSWKNYGYDYEYELVIDGIDNLTIEGEDAKIVTEPRISNVLSFINCDNLDISGLEIGHTEAAQACQGGVVSLDHCNKVNIENCSLYGCGTTGIDAASTDEIALNNCEIHNCSASGITLLQCGKVSVDDSTFHDCGNTEYGTGSGAVFSMYDCTGSLEVNTCSIYSNTFYSLLNANESPDENVALNKISISGNSFSVMFDADCKVAADELILKDNRVYSFLGNSIGEMTVNGNAVNEEDIESLYAEQLTSSGVGTGSAVKREISTENTREIHVSTTDEFLENLGSDTTIYIDVPQLNLTDASDYGMDAAEEWYTPDFKGRSYAWAEVFDGYQLYLGFLDNLNIIGGEIITEPRYANVLNFYGCSNIGLKNLKLGHSPEQGACCGGVVYFYCTDGITIDSCDLYGCGIMGIMSEYSSDMNVQGTLIHDCSEMAGSFSDSLNVAFIDCTVENCPMPHFTIAGTKNFTWNDKLMGDNTSFNAS